MKTHKVIFAGSGMPLEKTLESAVDIQGIEIRKVYLNIEIDHRIETFCQNHKIDVENINHLRGSKIDIDNIPQHDYLFSVNSTIIFPSELLKLPNGGAFNMHPGRLPDYAGLHTHQWAIRNGEKHFASTLHWMEPTVDTGAIAYIEHFEMKEKETGLSLFIKCLSTGSKLVVRALEDISQGNPIPRIDQNLHSRELYKEKDAIHSKIDWSWDAQKIERFIRAVDYGFSQSPTYKPLLSIESDTYLIEKAHPTIEKIKGNAGELIEVTPTQISIRAGDGACIEISKMKKLNSEENEFESFDYETLRPGMITK